MKNNKGFSLVELVVVIAIMAILIGVSVPVFTSYIEKSEIATDKSNVGELVRNIEVAGKTHAFKIDDVAQVSSDGLQVPVGFIVLSNDSIIVEGSDKGYVYIMTPGTDDGGVLEEILVGTYGDYENTLRLVSDTWTESNIPTLYAGANELFGEVKDLSKALFAAQHLSFELLGKKIDMPSRLDKTVMANGGYKTEVEIIHTIGTGIVNKISEDDFVENWKNAPLSNNMNYTFGLDGMSTEYYTAARRGYNEAIAKYIQNQSGDHQTGEYKKTGGSLWNPTMEWSPSDTPISGNSHASKIIECGASALGLTLSDTFNIGAWQSDSKKYNILGKEGSLDDEIQYCAKCKELCEAYASSPEAEADARAFYKVMQTLASNSPDVQLAVGNNDWNYYGTFVDNFSDLYVDLQTVTNSIPEGQSCVVVTVYCDPTTKELYCEVSPNSILEDS